MDQRVRPPEEIAQTHRETMQRVKNSHPSVLAVAYHLQQRGCIVEVPALVYAPTFEERARFKDGGDIKVHRNDGTKITEVKQCFAAGDFTCLDDWIFGSRMFIASTHLVDARIPECLGWFQVNKSLTHYALIRTEAVVAYSYDEEVYCKNSKLWELKKIIHPRHAEFRPLIRRG